MHVGIETTLECFVKTKRLPTLPTPYGGSQSHTQGLVPRNLICSKTSQVFLIHTLWLRITGFDDS